VGEAVLERIGGGACVEWGCFGWQKLLAKLQWSQEGLMPTRNVNLTDHLDRFIERGITSGRFGDASEVVREGLRLPEQREQEDEARVKWLRVAVKEGVEDIDHGEYTTLRSRREVDDSMRQLRKGASAAIAADQTEG
jgi:antitoxin ParD1/3/4